MPNSPEDRRKAVARVRRIRGLADALERALEAGEDCAPILQQLAAMRGAVNGLMAEVMAAHIRDELAAPEDPEALARDLTALVRSYLR